MKRVIPESKDNKISLINELICNLEQGKECDTLLMTRLLNYLSPKPQRLRSRQDWLIRALPQMKEQRYFLHFLTVYNKKAIVSDGARMHVTKTNLEDGSYDARDFTPYPSITQPEKHPGLVYEELCKMKTFEPTSACVDGVFCGYLVTAYKYGSECVYIQRKFRYDAQSGGPVKTEILVADRPEKPRFVAFHTKAGVAYVAEVKMPREKKKKKETDFMKSVSYRE